jgi:hypothetical protein
LPGEFSRAGDQTTAILTGRGNLLSATFGVSSVYQDLAQLGGDSVLQPEQQSNAKPKTAAEI